MAIEQVNDIVFSRSNTEQSSPQSGIDVASQSVNKAGVSGSKAENETQAKLSVEEKQKELKAEQEKEPDKKTVAEVIEFLNKEIPMVNTTLVFEFDELNEPPIVKVVDKANGETIREIPPKYLTDVSASLQEAANNLSNAGAFFDKKI